MILFSKDKEIISKIVNGVLLIWLVAALIFTAFNLITMLVKDPNSTSYNVYKSNYCSHYIEKDSLISEEDSEQQCKDNYERNKESENYRKSISLYTSIANVIIVGGVLYFLNKQRK